MRVLPLLLWGLTIAQQATPKPSSQANADLLDFVESFTPFDVSSVSGVIGGVGIEDPAKAGKADKPAERWVTGQDAARAMELSEISRIHVPIFVNIWVIGLDGGGNMKVAISNDQLESWLEHLDHRAPFTIIPGKTEKRKRQGKSARVDYRYQYRVINSSPLVLDVLELVMRAHFRQGGGSTQNPVPGTPLVNDIIQIDPSFLTLFLEDLIQYCHLDDAYNIFVLNPRFEWSGQGEFTRYGYRRGLSNSELDQLTDSTTLQQTVKQLNANQMSTFTSSPPKRPSDGKRRAFATIMESPFAVNRSAYSKVSRSDLLSVTEIWARQRIEELSKAPPGPLSVEGYLEYLGLVNAPLHGLQSLGDYAQEGCLSDNWVGESRTIWLDLAAGSSMSSLFHWGPTLDGEGSRTEHSLPSITSFESLKTTVEEQDQPQDQYVEPVYSLEQFEAERVLLNDLMRSHGCLQGNPNALCARWAEQLAVVNAMEASYTGNTGNSWGFGKKSAQASLDKPNAFSFLSSPDQHGNVNKHSLELESDQFLAHVGATITTALHHVITPTTDRLSFAAFAERVNFHVYVVANHNAYDPLQGNFSARLQDAINQLKLPNQNFYFTFRRMPIDEPSLATVFTTSLRDTVHTTFSSTGEFTSTHRVYLDSSIIETQLRTSEMKDHIRSRGVREGPSLSTASTGPGTRDIPIFLFSLDSPTPVFLDKEQQSVVAGSMVFAVQSPVHFEAPLRCNHRPLFLDMSNPIGPILASVARILGGLLPLHVSYAPSQQRVVQDWSWAVGSSPIVQTSQGLIFSQIQKDILHRNYVVSGILSATEIVNRATSQLKRLRVTVANKFLATSDTLLREFRSTEESLQQQQQQTKPVQRNIDNIVGVGVLLTPDRNELDLPEESFSQGERLSADAHFQTATTDVEYLQLHHKLILDTITEMWEQMSDLQLDRAASRLKFLHYSASRYARLVRRFAAVGSRAQCKSENQLPAGTDQLQGGVPFRWKLGFVIFLLFMIVIRLVLAPKTRVKIN